jgi:hypothetical protein
LPRTGIWAVLLAALSGCETGIEVRDSSTFFPTVRASKRLDDAWTIQGIADYGAGSGATAGSPGQPIVIGGASFNGAVDVDFDVTTLRVEGRVREEMSDHWIIDGFFGASGYYVDVTVSDGAQSADDDRFEWGPHFGGRIGWLPTPKLQVYGEVCGFYPFPDGVVINGTVDVGVEYGAGGPFHVLGGWRFRDLDLVLDDSDWEFEWSGPFFGVGFDF